MTDETGERARRSAQIALVGGIVVVMTAIRVSGVAIGNGRVFMAGAMPMCLMPIVMLVRLNLDRPHGAWRRT